MCVRLPDVWPMRRSIKLFWPYAYIEHRNCVLYFSYLSTLSPCSSIHMLRLSTRSDVLLCRRSTPGQPALRGTHQLLVLVQSLTMHVHASISANLKTVGHREPVRSGEWMEWKPPSCSAAIGTWLGTGSMTWPRRTCRSLPRRYICVLHNNHQS